MLNSYVVQCVADCLDMHFNICTLVVLLADCSRLLNLALVIWQLEKQQGDLVAFYLLICKAHEIKFLG